MRLILHYVGRYKALVLLNILSVFGFALAELGIPTVVADMIDTGVANADRGYLLRMGGVIALISVVGVAGTILLGFCCAKISTSVTRDIRRDIFDKVQTFSPAEFHKFAFPPSSPAPTTMRFKSSFLSTSCCAPRCSRR